MHEAERLTDDGMGASDEGREPKFRGHRPVAVKERAARRRAEAAIMPRKCCRDLIEEVGALRQFDICIAIGEPFGVGRRRPRDLLQTQDIGVDFRQISHQWGMELAAPGIEGKDAHGVHVSSSGAARLPDLPAWWLHAILNGALGDR
ncbi:hypothetical protein D9M70_467940 [compost metagenome]